MKTKRYPGREGAAVVLRQYFSGKYYQPRLKFAIERFVESCLPPITDPKTDPRLKKALGEVRRLSRIFRPNHRWLLKDTKEYEETPS